jgi:hypothetical protein
METSGGSSTSRKRRFDVDYNLELLSSCSSAETEDVRACPRTSLKRPATRKRTKGFASIHTDLLCKERLDKLTLDGGLDGSPASGPDSAKSPCSLQSVTTLCTLPTKPVQGQRRSCCNFIF